MRDDFFEPERRGGMMGWALRQVVLWLVAVLVASWIIANHALFSSQQPTVKPQAEATPVEVVPAVQPAPVLGRPVQSGVNSLTLKARADGHVLVSASVNGVPVKFLVDTGATTVALTPQDAVRAGVAGGLNYSIIVSTANGLSKAAPVTLRDVRIETLEIDDVHAEVMEAQGGISLLGQSFLSRLQSYQMHDGVLTLTWE